MIKAIVFDFDSITWSEIKLSMEIQLSSRCLT